MVVLWCLWTILKRAHSEKCTLMNFPRPTKPRAVQKRQTPINQAGTIFLRLDTKNTVIETSSSHCFLDLALIKLLVYKLTYTPHTVFVTGGRIYRCNTINVAQAVIENTYKNNSDAK